MSPLAVTCYVTILKLLIVIIVVVVVVYADSMQLLVYGLHVVTTAYDKQIQQQKFLINFQRWQRYGMCYLYYLHPIPLPI